MDFKDYQLHLIAVTIVLVSVYMGRLTVGAPSHEQECSPEIQSLGIAQRQIRQSESDQAQEIIRAAQMCTLREQQICNEKIDVLQATEYDVSCAICAKGGQDP